jgi:hypothetical protein
MATSVLEQRAVETERLLIVRQFVASLDGLDGVIADMVLCGHSYRTIARKLNLRSPGTISRHLRKLEPKLRPYIEGLPLAQEVRI